MTAQEPLPSQTDSHAATGGADRQDGPGRAGNKTCEGTVYPAGTDLLTALQAAAAEEFPTVTQGRP